MSGQAVKTNAKDIHKRSLQFIPGGASSINRLVEPSIAFAKGQGAYLWDNNGKRYIDFHAAFAPHLLGHNNPDVNDAVVNAIGAGSSLYGSGPNELEVELAQLICENIQHIDKATFLNTGSEATALAIKLSRAATGKHHFIVMQGGYNGNSDELACNVFNDLNEIGPRVSPGEYRIRPLGAGTVIEEHGLVHVVNYNDLESVRYVCQRYPVAAVITEPVLQNIGVVLPTEGFLSGLRKLADELEFVLIFDEVKTGFRHSFGGYAEISGVAPDLVTYGKAVANGYPISILGGKAELMDLIAADDLKKRPLVAGTYNGHPAAVAAAIATLQILKSRGEHIYSRLDELGQAAEDGIQNALRTNELVGTVVRLGSAFSYYFMDHAPRDFHDLLVNHDFALDVAIRRALIDAGIYFIPIATKQCSISASHSMEDINRMVDQFKKCVAAVTRH